MKRRKKCGSSNSSTITSTKRCVRSAGVGERNNNVSDGEEEEYGFNKGKDVKM